MSDQISDQVQIDAAKNARTMLQPIKVGPSVLANMEVLENILARLVQPNRPMTYSMQVLINFMKMDVPQVDELVTAIGEQMVMRMEEVAAEFAEVTGMHADPSKPLKPVIEAEYEREIQQQDGEIQQAKQILAWITEVSATLGNSYAPPAPTADKEKSATLLTRFMGALVVTTPKVVESTTPSVEGWLSEAKLPMADEDIKILKTVQQTISFYPNDVSTAVSELNSFGYSSKVLAGLYDKCWLVATDEITSSTQIKETVTRQYIAWVNELEAIEAVLDHIAAVNNYFHPPIPEKQA